MSAVLPSGSATSVGPAGHSASASVSLANVADARKIPWAFWGVNVAAAQGFSSSDAARIAATPVDFVRFPGGILGEEYNYTSGVLTNINGGTTTTARTSAQEFVTACNSMHCKAILQLPAEIDQPQTAAYYANYVVNSLHFRPAYWEIGNSVPSWNHFDTPWSQWSSRSGAQITATVFAKELGKYISAIRAVVPGARFIALGMAMGYPNNNLNYISEVAKLDGKNISGVSVHSYVVGGAPAHPTAAEFLANLNGKYSLDNSVTEARGYLASACPKCNLKVFVTEANGAEVNAFTQLLPTFAGTTYVAADAVQALNLRVTNLDWFAYDSSYPGAWETRAGPGEQYTLMSQMMNHLGPRTLATTVTGPSLFFAVATYGSSSGLALLMVNANVTQSLNVDLSKAGILAGASVHVEQWKNGSVGPTNSSLTFLTSITIPAFSITILTVSPSGLDGGTAPTHHHRAADPRAAPHRAPSAPANAAPAPVDAGFADFPFAVKETPTQDTLFSLASGADNAPFARGSD